MESIATLCGGMIISMRRLDKMTSSHRHTTMIPQLSRSLRILSHYW